MLNSKLLVETPFRPKKIWSQDRAGLSNETSDNVSLIMLCCKVCFACSECHSDMPLQSHIMLFAIQLYGYDTTIANTYVVFSERAASRQHAFVGNCINLKPHTHVECVYL